MSNYTHQDKFLATPLVTLALDMFVLTSVCVCVLISLSLSIVLTLCCLFVQLELKPSQDSTDTQWISAQKDATVSVLNNQNVVSDYKNFSL